MKFINKKLDLKSIYIILYRERAILHHFSDSEGSDFLK